MKMSIKFVDVDLNSDAVPVEVNNNVNCMLESTIGEVANLPVDDDSLIRVGGESSINKIRVSGEGIIEEDLVKIGNTGQVEMETRDDGKSFDVAESKDSDGLVGNVAAVGVGIDSGMKGDDAKLGLETVDDSKVQDLNMLGLVVDLNAYSVADGERKSENRFVNGVTEDKMLSRDLGVKQFVHEEQETRIEKEGEFYVSDLVWGKVRSHPWWPGQIYDPSAASEKARKYKKKESVLIAYFGDQSFAWNDALRIKPFRMHFPQMDKQSSLESFTHAVECALEEVSRRVECGLACLCLPEEVRTEIKSQVIINAGIRKEASLRVGGDNFSTAASFVPAKLVLYLRELAKDPFSVSDRLEFVTSRAQLLAFNRWKGYTQLPAFRVFAGFSNDDVPVFEKKSDPDYAALASKSNGQVSSGKGKSIIEDSFSQKCKHISGDGECSRKKVKCMSDLMSTGSRVTANKMSSSSQKKLFRVGDRISRVANQLSVSSASNLEYGEKTSQEDEKGVNLDMATKYPSAKEMLSKLSLAAIIYPAKDYSFMSSASGFFSEFRNSVCFENSNSGKDNQWDKQTGKILSNAHTVETFGFEGVEDSYWPDMIVQPNSQDHVLFEPEGAKEMPITDEKLEEDSPTALTLNFTDLESLPSKENLNKIFSRFGPLYESDTEVLKKSKRAKVVFKKCPDAETAFSSAGKFSTFGPSLVSYKLNYAPPPRKRASQGLKRKRKEATSSSKGNEF